MPAALRAARAPSASVAPSSVAEAHVGEAHLPWRAAASARRRRAPAVERSLLGDDLVDVVAGTRGRCVVSVDDLARRVSPRRNASPTYHSRSRVRDAQLLLAARAVGRAPRARRRSRALPISSERIAFCSDSLKVRPIAIASPTDFICGPRTSLGLRELLEGEARDLGDDVVDGRLEAGRRLARDVVPDLVERVADGELGGDLGDREAGRLATPAPSCATRAGSSR